MATEGRIVTEILRKNEPLLNRHLVLSKTVMDKLHQQGLVPDYVRRKILMHPAHQQVGMLLKTLEGRGLASLRKFLQVLKETGHSYLVDHVLDTEAIPVSDLHRPDTTQPLSGRQDYQHRRPVHTVHAANRNGGLPTSGHVASLNSLLRMRQDQEQASATRGAVLPRTMLTDPVAVGYQPGGSGLGLGGSPITSYHHHHGHPPPAAYSTRKDNLPSTLYNLSQMFNQQQKEQEQAMVVLRQEEMAIKQLMEQNARDQQKIRRKQFTMTDMSKRLADINARASEIYEPTPHPDISRYRLAQLNQIPWTMD